MDVVVCALLNTGGQWRSEAASLALGGSGAVNGASGGGGDGVDLERCLHDS